MREISRIETTLHRILQNRFFFVHKADLVFSGPFAYLKHLLSYIVQVAFFDVQDAQNELAWPFDTLKHPFIDSTKIIFNTYKRQIMSSKGHSPT
jgi:hypothetical protein